VADERGVRTLLRQLGAQASLLSDEDLGRLARIAARLQRILRSGDTELSRPDSMLEP
jgi:hypothetical protein